MSSNYDVMGRMYFEGMEFKARAESAEAKLAAIRALAENVTTYWWSDALDCWVVRCEDVLAILGA